MRFLSNEEITNFGKQYWTYNFNIRENYVLLWHTGVRVWVVVNRLVKGNATDIQSSLLDRIVSGHCETRLTFSTANTLVGWFEYRYRCLLTPCICRWIFNSVLVSLIKINPCRFYNIGIKQKILRSNNNWFSNGKLISTYIVHFIIYYLFYMDKMYE